MNVTEAAEQFSGAMTLLRDCVGGQSGERLLIVSEPEGSGYYDNDAPRITAEAARMLGMHVYQTQSECFLVNPDDTRTLMDTLRGFDHIVFFSRVGDQIRFSNDTDMPSATMCYTLDLESLNSEFGTACYHGMCEIKTVIDTAFSLASHVRLTCPLGTDYSGYPSWQENETTDVSIKRFPMLVSRPVPTQGLHGRIALSRFLVGTGSHIYEPYVLPLPSVVYAQISNEHIESFDGAPDDIRRVEQHYRHVSQQFAIEPWFVHSWHAGIHPGCHFNQPAEKDTMRWSGSAFGNPRLLHFHTCGAYAPGEISWNLLDPTIWLDDVPVWENGRLYPERLAGSDALSEKHPHLLELYQRPHTNVGLSS